MSFYKYDYYYISSIDPHNNMYTNQHWRHIEYISGFNGSYGNIVIGIDDAYLWTDGRYFLQAKNQLDEKVFTLKKREDFLENLKLMLLNTGQCKTIALNPATISISQAKSIINMTHEVHGKYVFNRKDLIDEIKQKDESIQYKKIQKIFIQRKKYSGQSVEKKLGHIRRQLYLHKVGTLVVTVLDEIAWLLNIRGYDTPFSPLVISYLLLTRTSCTLFIDPRKLNAEVTNYLKVNQVQSLPYESFFQFLSQCKGKVWIDDNTANYLTIQELSKEAGVFYRASPIILPRACKNCAEINGAKKAHRKDAIALISFRHWLENNFRGQSEITAKEKLECFRQEQQDYKGPSFSTISAFDSNGAIIHYKATVKTAKTLSDRSLYLVDSGGQYLEGTTDVTRTFHLGKPTQRDKDYYTLVLKGHLAVRNTPFPKGTTGSQIDTLARAALWERQLDYPHGTGHGVGSFLCVHEGPQGLSHNIYSHPLLPSMIISNEPGVYFDNRFGIRIENLCFVKVIKGNCNGNKFYKLEDLTLVPYEKKLVNVNLLSKKEIKYINTYHDRIKRELLDMIGNSDVKRWLLKNTTNL